MNAYIEDKVLQGTCSSRTAKQHNSQIRGWLGGWLEVDMANMAKSMFVYS